MRLDTSIAEITGRGSFYEPWRRRPAITRRRRHPLAHGIVKRRYRRLAQPRPDQTSGRMVGYTEVIHFDGLSAPRTSGGSGVISHSTTSASESPGHQGHPALGSYPRVVRPAEPPQRPDRSPQVAMPRSALTAAWAGLDAAERRCACGGHARPAAVDAAPRRPTRSLAYRPGGSSPLKCGSNPPKNKHSSRSASDRTLPGTRFLSKRRISARPFIVLATSLRTS